MPRPNILLIFTDQQRADTIAALGNPVIRTPALDRLAREGTAFTRAYCPSPVCVPSRYSIVTGLPPHRTGCVDNGGAASPAPPSFMQRLAEAGYQTHGVGKMHFVPDPAMAWGFQSRDVSEEMGQRDDFDQFISAAGYDHVEDRNGVRSEMYYIPQPSQLPARLHHTTWTADRSIDFLRRRDRSRPFFLWTSFIKPHPPFETPTPWNKLYRAAEMAPPFRPEGFERLLTYWNRVQNRYKYRDHGYDELLVRTMRAAYYACISFIDFHVGRLLEALGGEADETLIVFSTDHGELLGDYGSVGKRCMLDAAAKVPLIVRWPGRAAAGGRCGAPASLQDIWRTVLRAGGADDSGPSEEDSVDLLDLAGRTGDSTGATGGGARRELVFSQFQQGGVGLYLAASASQKYVYSAADGREWLFDAALDPQETRDLSDDSLLAGDLARLRQATIQRFQRDGYAAPLVGDAWKAWPRREIPGGPDYGLLFQDSPGLQARIDALGPYARKVTVPPEEGIKILKPRP
jgi:arylsulfatase A-like enzyme